MSTIRRHLASVAVALSALALFVSLGGASAATNAVQHALTADRAKVADTVDGLHASTAPKAGKLLALDKRAKLPASVVPVITGSQGPKGGAGATGAQGPKGDARPRVLRVRRATPAPPAPPAPRGRPDRRRRDFGHG